jgi:hypothetical protein
MGTGGGLELQELLTGTLKLVPKTGVTKDSDTTGREVYLL